MTDNLLFSVPSFFSLIIGMDVWNLPVVEMLTNYFPRSLPTQRASFSQNLIQVSASQYRNPEIQICVYKYTLPFIFALYMSVFVIGLRNKRNILIF